MTPDEAAVAVAVAESISRELDEDYVGLWVVAWHIRRRVEDASNETVYAVAEAILSSLVESAVRIGSLAEESGTFTPWSADAGVKRAMREWMTLGRDPNIGEIAWLVRER
jgi:hypothetical protein